jgi:hypothetical protein
MRQRQELAHGDCSAVDFMVPLDDRAEAIADSASNHTLQEGRPASPGGFQGQRAADESNAFVAKSDNVLHGFDDSLVVIHIDVCDQGLRLSHIQNDDRQSAMGKLIEKVGSNFSEVMMATPSTCRSIMRRTQTSMRSEL